ncbi:hypothetical protein JCM11641_007984 [Rhodosporidiobolus odoratus]
MDPLGNLNYTTSGALLDLVDSTCNPSLLASKWLLINIPTAPRPPTCSFTCFAFLPAEKVLVHLRDDRRLIGVLRSYDQYANLVLTQTVERLYHPPSKSYAQTERGVFLVRGENVVLLGEVDLDLEDAPLQSLTLVPWTQLSSLLASEQKHRLTDKKDREKVLFERQGFGEEGGEGDAY